MRISLLPKIFAKAFETVPPIVLLQGIRLVLIKKKRLGLLISAMTNKVGEEDSKKKKMENSWLLRGSYFTAGDIIQ